ncbi:HEPN domain-containing protein [Mucilaginibacter aquaedulcis]|uniref:HEPN domain-containing protein n=1 Tax=Mucilaginibacter aquaedulcis TaxID=1187081 RepID=UPI0025B4C3C2|nr:HEPN domain-containing protein [Mucilaginibacter aquaedulcis]MDN3551579.1 HEPN domain-containing protein [Mucilaginibacter aquaedulcis]
MENNQCNSRLFYPKYLDAEEINDPLNVIQDFFSVDWLPGHMEKLREWRKYVIEQNHYDEVKNSSATLLYTHQLNAKLLEALYMLSKTKLANKLADAINIHFEEQLHHEESTWLHYPVYLSPIQRINPYLALSNIFQVYSIDQYRDFLYEWLETGFSNDSADETLDISDVIYFYENMQKLYEVAWIIRQREFDPILKESWDNNELELGVKSQKTSGLSLIKNNCSFNEQPNPTEWTGINQLVQFILQKVLSPQLIIFLGTHPHPSTIYLLIIVDDREKRPDHEIVKKIEDNCGHLINVYAIVHKSGAFIKAIGEGDRFFNNALLNNKICYQSADIILPELKPRDQVDLKTTIEGYWRRWGCQGKDFWNAALNAHHDDNNNLAVFLMHQSVESTLNAIIRIILGYRLTIHNLKKLLGLTLLFTDDLINVFDSSSIEDVQLLTLLQDGYSAARYKEDFNTESKAVKALLDKTDKIVRLAENCYEKARNISDDEILNIENLCENCSEHEL